MAVADFRFENKRFVRACSGGLSERTAFVDVVVPGLVAWDHNVDQRLRAGAAALNQAEPLYGVADGDWPGAFLVPDEGRANVDDHALWRLGEWVVALTLAVQRWGRDAVWRGRVLSAESGRIRLAIPWFREGFFDEAAALALHRVQRWSESEDDWSAVAGEGPGGLFGDRWADIQAGGLGPETLRFIHAALRRGMPFDVRSGIVQIGWGAEAERFDFTFTGRTSAIGAPLAKNKLKALQSLEAAGLPVPRASVVTNPEHARREAQAIGWPVVVKPLTGDGGVGVVTGIRDEERLIRACELADQATSGGGVLLEKHYDGDDHRLLVVDGAVLQVARRTPAHVVGDGAHSVRELLERFNADPRRGSQRYSLLKTVTIDEDVTDYLGEQELQPDSVPEAGRIVWLARIANISAGGTAEDVTTLVHPENIALAARAARIIGLDIAGIDFLCPDITRSWREVGGVICEVNAQPGLRPHWLADPARDISAEIFDIVIGDRSTRVPTAAITGTNGKTTTAEMLYRIWTAAGKLTGVCTTERVRIGEDIVTTDNLSGQPGARIILNDPAVEAAVLEMPRKGLIYFGHHCDRYDVGALLNVQDDHIGVDGIDTIEQMAELKAEVLQRSTRAIVVNAEDALCLAMRARAGTDRHILVGRAPQVAAIVEHRRRGGEAVFLDQRDGRPWIILATGEAEISLMPVHDIPATMNGILAFNETNAMFAAALAWAQSIDTGIIRQALGSFHSTVDENPGRFNFVDGLPFDLLLDFAHNPDGVRGVSSLVGSLPVAGRRLLCCQTIGNRHAHHIGETVRLLAGSFDDFVISCSWGFLESPEYDRDDPGGDMVRRFRGQLLDHGVPTDRIAVDLDFRNAIRRSLDRARPGDLVVVLASYWQEAHGVVAEWRQERSQNGGPRDS